MAECTGKTHGSGGNTPGVPWLQKIVTKMADSTPWFKFKVSEWNDGDISLRSYHLRGLFISICSYYWSRGCELTFAQAYDRFGQRSRIDELVTIGCLGRDEATTGSRQCDDGLTTARRRAHDGAMMRIRFLDDQWLEKLKKAEINRKNGENGGRPETQSVSSQKGNKKRGEGEERRREERLPFGAPFALAWGEWVQHRKEKREPLKPTTIEKQLKMLGSMSEQEAVSVINYSITGGYTGLFPERASEGKTGLPRHV